METKVIRLDLQNGDSLRVAVEAAKETLLKGGVIMYPTDTVYGLGADAENAAAVEKIRMIKGRDEAKPMLALVADTAMLAHYAHVNASAEKLSTHFFPGPLSLVLKVKDERLSAIAKEGSVGFRVPNHLFCLLLSKALGCAIVSTSVNKSGETPSRDVATMLHALGEATTAIDLVIDQGQLPTGEPSTVVDAMREVPVILREGAISGTDILNV